MASEDIDYPACLFRGVILSSWKMFVLFGPEGESLNNINTDRFHCLYVDVLLSAGSVGGNTRLPANFSLSQNEHFSVRGNSLGRHTDGVNLSCFNLAHGY